MNSTAPDPEAERLGLARALTAAGASHVFGLVAGPGGHPADVAGLGLGDVEVLDADAALSLVDAPQRSLVADAITRAMDRGAVAQVVPMADGSRATTHLFDLSRSADLILGVVVPFSPADHRPVSPVPAAAPGADGARNTGERLLRRLAERLPDGVLQLDADRRLVYANGRARQLLGADHGLAGLVARTLSEDRPALRAAISAALGAGEDRTVEVRVRTPEGDSAVYEVALRAVPAEPVPDGGPAVAGALCCIADVTGDVRRRDLDALASFDELTATFDRAATLRALTGAVRDAGPGAGVAVVLVDLDDLALVNDAYGRRVGDRLLQTVAERLRDAVRAVDVVGRLGGDELLVVCPELTDPALADALRDRLSRALGEPVALDDAILVPSASVGLAWTFDAAVGADALVTEADTAMRAARRERRQPD